MPTGCPSSAQLHRMENEQCGLHVGPLRQLCFAMGNENGPAKAHRSFDLDTQDPAALRAA